MEFGKMAQRMKALVTKPDSLSSVLQIYMVEGKNRLLQIVLWSLHLDTPLIPNKK